MKVAEERRTQDDARHSERRTRDLVVSSTTSSAVSTAGATQRPKLVQTTFVHKLYKCVQTPLKDAKPY